MFVQTLARILAAKMNVRVVYDHTISTFKIGSDKDGSLVILLAANILETAGENVDAVLRGALAHEALGHGYHTDFSSLATKGEYAMSLANAFEDVRIEQLAPARFPGARRILAQMVEVLDRDFGFWDAPPADDWQESLLIGLLRKYRSKILGHPLDPRVTQVILDQAIPVIGEDLFRKVDHLAETACRSASTQEVNEAADAIVVLLTDAQKKNQGQGGDKPQDGDASKSQGNGKGDQSQGNGDRNNPSQPGGKNNQVGNPGQGGNSGEGSGTPQGGTPQGRNGTPFDPSKKVSRDIESALESVSNDRNAVQQAGVSAYHFVDKSDEPHEEGTLDTTETNGALVRRISARLEEAVRSVTEDADDEEADVGRLNVSMLPTIVTGTSCRPFIEDGAPGPGIDTELMLLVDSSRSMDDLGEPLIRQLLKASLTALARLAPDLGTCVAFFSEGSKLMASPGQRLTPLKINDVASRYYARGGTAWEQSIVPLIPVLATSRRRRKILLTVTDGQLARSVTPAVMREMRTQGIECRFLSIGLALPEVYEGVRCDATPEAFAKSFCDTILAGILPAYA